MKVVVSRVMHETLLTMAKLEVKGRLVLVCFPLGTQALWQSVLYFLREEVTGGDWEPDRSDPSVCDVQAALGETSLLPALLWVSVLGACLQSLCQAHTGARPTETSEFGADKSVFMAGPCIQLSYMDVRVGP